MQAQINDEYYVTIGAFAPEGKCGAIYRQGQPNGLQCPVRD